MAKPKKIDEVKMSAKDAMDMADAKGEIIGYKRVEIMTIASIGII
jgi:hypothetical protein